MDTLILNNLTKSYDGVKKVVNNLNFTVGEGSIFGFLGPNGAGKTTTVKMLGGLILPSSGDAIVLDFNPAKDPHLIHKNSGLLTETAGMYNNMTAKENLLFFGRLYGMKSNDADSHADTLLKELELSKANGKVKTFSTGMKKRLSLARVLLHRPKLLFLDEPTSGLDPESAASVMEIMKQQSINYGCTIFLSTHQLRYAEGICSNYGLISNGKMLAVGTIDDLRIKAEEKLTVNIRGTIPDGLMEKVEDNLYQSLIKSKEDITPLIKNIISAGGEIYEITVPTMSLEDIYFALLRKEGESNEDIN